MTPEYHRALMDIADLVSNARNHEVRMLEHLGDPRAIRIRAYDMVLEWIVEKMDEK